MELHDVSYGIDNGLEVGSIRRIQVIGYGVLEFLGVGTTFDIFQNIHILYLEYGVLSSSGYGVFIFFPLWSLTLFDVIKTQHKPISSRKLNNKEEWTTKDIQCQLTPKDLIPGNFTLPCTIGNFNFFLMADLGASVNVIPRNTFEYLRLANLRNTNMLVEMADMMKKAPLGLLIETLDNAKEQKDGVILPWTSFWQIGKYQNNSLVWGDRYVEWCNVSPTPGTSSQESNNLRPRDYTFREWTLIKKKGHMLDKIWEYCKDFHRDSTYWWHEYGFEEEERDEMRIEIEKYDLPKVQVETFKVRKDSFKGGQMVVCVTKEVDDALPLGRRDGSRSKEMI
ncbi:hypothetical protein Tco_1458884 [Tanacetum coccineum]